jgi:hypothetical protein
VPPPPDDTFAHAQGGNTNFTAGGWGANYNPTTLHPQSNTLFPGASGGFQPQPFSSMGLAPASWSAGQSQYLPGPAPRPGFPAASMSSYHSDYSSHAGDDERLSQFSRRGSDYDVDYSGHTGENADRRGGQYDENPGQGPAETEPGFYDPKSAPQLDLEGGVPEYHDYGDSVDQGGDGTKEQGYHVSEEGGHDDMPNLYDGDA